MTTTNVNPIQDYIDENYKHRSGATGLAKDVGVGYQTVHKATMGLYTSIPTKLVEFMARTTEYNIDEWQKLYSLWVEKELRILVNDIKTGALEAEAFFVPPINLNTQYKNFSEWREALSYSQIDFCKTFLLHQAIIQKYEAGTMKAMPESLVSRVRYVMDALFEDDTHTNAYLIALKLIPRKKDIL